MDGIGSALGDQVHLRAGGAAGRGVIVAGSDAEFLQRVERGAHRPLEGIAFELIVIVQSIEGYVALIAASTVDGAAAAIVVLLIIRHIADEDDAGLEAENRGRISTFRRQIR